MKVTIRCNQGTYDNPPKTGNIIRVKYDGCDSNGELQFNHLPAVFMSIRTDTTWSYLKDQYLKRNKM